MMWTDIVVNLVGLILIVLLAWWFWLAKRTKKRIVQAEHHGVIDIKVADGIYDPAVIEAAVGKKIALRFTRYEENPCAETVVFADFNKSAQLPVGESVIVEITPKQAGEYEFTCQMGMYRGKLIAR